MAGLLGFVGAGDSGARTDIAISLFSENQVLTFLIYIYASATLADYFSEYLKRRFITEGPSRVRD